MSKDTSKKDKTSLTTSQITAGIEAQADAAALMELLPLLRVRAMLHADPKITGGVEVGSAPAPAQQSDGAADELTEEGGVAAVVATTAKAASAEFSSAPPPPPELLHPPPVLPPSALSDTSPTDAVYIGRGLWELFDALAPSLPCAPSLRDESGKAKKEDDDDDDGPKNKKKRGKKDEPAIVAAKSTGEGSCEPVRFLRMRVQSMVLQLQLALYKTYEDLTSRQPHTHRDHANDRAHSDSRSLDYPSATATAASDAASKDAAIVLRALRRLHATLRDSSAPPSARPHAGALPKPLIEWDPLAMPAEEWKPTWMKTAVEAEPLGIAGADPAAWMAIGPGAAVGFCADGLDSIGGSPPLTRLVHAASRVATAMKLVGSELLRLSRPPLQGASEHGVLELQMMSLANGGHSHPSKRPNLSQACRTGRQWASTEAGMERARPR